MKVLVYDVAARAGGGGAAILDQYYQAAVNDQNNEWWFIVSLADTFADTERIHILHLKNETSYLRRIISRWKFEKVELRRLLSDINPDKVISLQNTPVPGAKCIQEVYLHQSIQFSPVKFSFFKAEERSLAFRQRFICSLIRRKLKKADKVIVQTNWMREAVSKWARYPKERIVVEPPRVTTYEGDYSCLKKKENTFFYPASPYIYKNHTIILKACEILKEAGIENYSVDFTFFDDSNELAKELYHFSSEHGLPINFIGHQDRNVLYEMYQTRTMLFPSYMETFGLPLVEAKSVDGNILASNCPFAFEALGTYKKVRFLKWDDPTAWAEAMKQCINNQD